MTTWSFTDNRRNNVSYDISQFPDINLINGFCIDITVTLPESYANNTFFKSLEENKGGAFLLVEKKLELVLANGRNDDNDIYASRLNYPGNSPYIQFNTDGTMQLTFVNRCIPLNNATVELRWIKYTDLSKHIVSLYENRNGTWVSLQITTKALIKFSKVFIGDTKVDGTGFDFGNTIITSKRSPELNYEVTPKLYVDTYIKSQTEYLMNMIDSVSNNSDILDRLLALEAKVERLYQALYRVPSNIPIISVADPADPSKVIKLTFDEQTDVNPSYRHTIQNAPPPPFNLQFD